MRCSLQSRQKLQLKQEELGPRHVGKKAAEKSLRSACLQGSCFEWSIFIRTYQASKSSSARRWNRTTVHKYITHAHMHRKQTPLVQRAGTPFDLQRFLSCKILNIYRLQLRYSRSCSQEKRFSFLHQINHKSQLSINVLSGSEFTFW